MDGVKNAMASVQKNAEKVLVEAQEIANKAKASVTGEAAQAMAHNSVDKEEAQRKEEEEKAKATHEKEQKIADVITERHHTGRP